MKKLLKGLLSLSLVFTIVSCTAQVQTNKPESKPATNNIKPPSFDDFAFGNGSGYMRGFRGGNGSGMGQNQGVGNPNGQGMGQGNPNGMGNFANDNKLLGETLATINKADLNEAEKADLLYMREEEKMARDVYITLFKKWSQKSFDNISKSEQFHTDAVKILLDRYTLTDPVTNDEVGVFTNKIIKDLYETLIKDGNESLEKALKVGAKIEEVDIKDLKKSIANTDNEDLKYLYDTLASASENHLRAFTSNLKKFFNVEYAPAYLSKEDFDKIVK